MKDTKKILRTAIYNALNGNVNYLTTNVPVYDEKLPNGVSSNIYLILSTQSELNIENNDSVWITESSIDFELYHKTGIEVSKDIIDIVYEDVLEILLPTTQTIGINVPSGFQFLNARRDSSTTQSISLTDTESVLLNRFRLTFTIVQK